MPGHLVETLILIVVFLSVVSLLQEITKKLKFPFVVALLLLGFAVRWGAHFLNTPLELSLSPDFIFFVLLPLLLFGSALHINIHQFKLQFKTIAFLATFGLMVSIFVVAGLVSWLIGLPLLVALLFGTMISATDPIAVLALFKSLGAPKRLGLIADGESMFNDATAVIAFRVVLALVLGTVTVNSGHILGTAWTLVSVFIGSIVVGLVAGLLGSLVIDRIKNDTFVETTITVILALGTFILAEHFLHLSGVIATVITGITVGNLGVTRISGGVINFITDFWEYVGTVSIALVFFFTAFAVDLELITNNLWPLALVVLSVLIARGVSVYLTVFITNKVALFANEPDVSWSWQHILNWGGLRGVIPLVLVFSLPPGFAFKEELLVYTLGVLLFSLIVNGLSIQWLLKWLGLHLPRKEEVIIAEEMSIFEIEKIREKLAKVPDVSAEREIVKEVQANLLKEEDLHRKKLVALANAEELLTSLHVQALRIERSTVKSLFNQGLIDEGVFYDLEAQFDLQQDSLEYAEIFKTRAVKGKGFVDMGLSFRRRLRSLRALIQDYPILRRIVRASREQLIQERYMMLKARILGNEAVLNYLDHVDRILETDKAKHAFTEITAHYKSFLKSNKEELGDITDKYPLAVKKYQQAMIKQLLAAPQFS